MPNTYVQDVKKIVHALSTDESLSLEGKLILLGLVTDDINEATKELEGELAGETGDQSR